MDDINDLNAVPAPTRLEIMRGNWQSRWWAVQHWMRTHLMGLQFCHSCSGYFQEWSMTLPDKCRACYARDYGVPTGH